MRFELVVFDCDGVLVDTERLTVGVEAELLTALGWAHTPEAVVARFMGRSLAAQLVEVAAVIGPDKARQFEVDCEAAIYEAFERELVEVPGITALLDALVHHGMPTCVASSGTHKKMQTTLGLTGLFTRFQGRIFSASEVAKGKPAPDLFLHAAARMGARPDRTAVVEDSAFGVEAAVRAGMVAFGYGGGLAPEGALLSAGATVFSHMSDLADLLLAD